MATPVNLWNSGTSLPVPRVHPSPEVGVQVFEDLVLVLDRLDDGFDHLRAVAAHVRIRGCGRSQTTRLNRPKKDALNTKTICKHKKGPLLLHLIFSCL